MMPALNMPLAWSLVVPTLNREDVLIRSLRANVRQTRPPSQVIVVDSSENWQQTRDRVLAEVAPEAPNVEWVYIGSDIRSSTRQRNLGLARCTGDVVFFLDDDSFMYRDCAEQIMLVYEGDTDEKIGGVCASLADRQEGVPAPNGGSEERGRSLRSRLMQLVERQWWQVRLFIPYDGQFHVREVEGFSRDVVSVPVFHGCRMTFRTKAVRELAGFEEMLIGAAYGEDIDLSYRVSRQRALVAATKASLCHEQVPVARPKRQLNTALVLLNAIALYKLNRADDGAAGRFAYSFLLERATLEFLRDCARPRRWMPHTLGAVRAARFVPAVLRLEREALRHEYPGMQRRLYELCR
jgi:GT2 family glycosyltransferase